MRAVGTNVFDEPLHGGAEPRVELKSETPHHRAMVYLYLQGMSQREIATRLGFTPVHVSTVLRQPWAREMMAKVLKEEGRSNLATMLSAAAEDSVITVLELRDNPKVPASVRLQAAVNLLDRVLGKPTQRVETANLHVSLPATQEDVEALDVELEKLKKEEQRIRGVKHGN